MGELPDKMVDLIAKTPLPIIATALLKFENPTTEIDSLKLSDKERREQFGARVKMMRQLLGLSQKQLGEKIGVTNQNIAYYEKGKREPSHKSLIGLSRALNVSTDWLLGEPPMMKEA